MRPVAFLELPVAANTAHRRLSEETCKGKAAFPWHRSCARSSRRLEGNLSYKLSWKSFPTEVACLCFCFDVFVVLFKNNDPHVQAMRFALISFPGKAATEDCLPGGRHHRSWVKVRNLIIVSSGVWWPEAMMLGCGEQKGMVSERCVSAYSFMQQALGGCGKSPRGVPEIWIPEKSLASWVISFVQWLVAILLRCAVWIPNTGRLALCIYNTCHYEAVAEKCSWMW